MNTDEIDVYNEKMSNYLADNMKRGMIELLESFKGNESAEISGTLNQVDSELAVKIIQYLKSYYKNGKLTSPELAVVGKMFIDWFDVEASEIVEHELKKEFDSEQ